MVWTAHDTLLADLIEFFETLFERHFVFRHRTLRLSARHVPLFIVFILATSHHK